MEQKKEITLNNQQVMLIKKSYAKTNQIWLETYDEDGNHFPLTVNLKDHSIPEGFVALKDYGENKGITKQLIDQNIVEKEKAIITLNDHDIVNVCKLIIFKKAIISLPKDIILSSTFLSLQNMAKEYVENREKGKYEDEDLKQYMFEGVVELFYGKEIWNYLRQF